MASVHSLPQLPLDLYEPPSPAILDIPQQTYLSPGLPGEAGQGERHFIDRYLGRVGLQAAPDYGRSPLPHAHWLPEADDLLPGLPAGCCAPQGCRPRGTLSLNSGLAYALSRRLSTATNRTSIEEEWNGSETCSTTDSSNGMGTTGLSSIPLQSAQARPPPAPNWSTSMCLLMEAASPMVCSPKRCIPVFTPVETGSRSMECGARNTLTSSGTLDAPNALLVRAATKAWNLASATPTRGFRYAGTAISRAETAPASPRYSPSRPSSRT